MHKSFRASASFAFLALIFCGGAMAQTTSVKFGWASVDPQASASAIYGAFIPTDALSLNIKKQSTVFFSLAQEVDQNVEVELALGIPPTHDNTLVVLNPQAVTPGTATLNGQLVATVRQIAPTFFVNYYFQDSSSAFRPFVGVGMNYTVFDNASSSAVNDAINGGVTSIKLSDSSGLALQVGASMKLGGPWTANASWSTAQVKTKMTSNTLGIVRNADITFKPSVFIVSLGYSF